MISFEEFAGILKKSATEVKPRLIEDATEIGEFQLKTARELIGHENNTIWPPLAEKTVEEKERLGFTGQVSSDDPLLRTGMMRDSIEYVVEPDVTGVEITLGSNDPVALYQEMGTATIPPRPFLSTAVIRSFEFAEKVLGKTVLKLLEGK